MAGIPVGHSSEAKMDNSSILSFILILLLVVVAVFTIWALPGSERYDVRWTTMTATLMSVVCLVYIATWIWSIDRSLKLLNKLLIDQDELLRPELKGAMQLLLQRLREIWKWGLPKA